MFPDIDNVLDRVRESWDLDRELPVPKFDLQCPICNCGQIQLRQYSFHYRHKTGSRNPYRCDVSFKCTQCSLVWTHGVVVPEAMYKRHENEMIHWREAKEILRGD